MEDAESREQHNHGSGTFVGGDVNGGIWHIFLPPYGKKQTAAAPARQHRPERDDEEPDDDYDDLAATLALLVLAASVMGTATVHEAMGWPWSKGGPSLGITERIIGGLVFFYGFLACVAAFFARLAQVFELWAEQCTVTATQSRGRWVARPPAFMSRAVAALAAAAASLAEVLASLYGWRSFGGEVSQRAHTARLNAAANARAARAAAKGLQT
ncbi:hypothetical protein [Streptomyces sp. NPDC048196]|uniref:hypothetical protein n=1 Tax=Streptomyces sp. NPDC048196 TaxID=3154712 RepID=UPI00340A7347